LSQGKGLAKAGCVDLHNFSSWVIPPKIPACGVDLWYPVLSDLPSDQVIPTIGVGLKEWIHPVRDLQAG